MAQAEHDINAQSILITDDFNFAKNILREIKILTTNSLKKKLLTKVSERMV